MPNAKVLETKKEIVAGLAEKLKNSASGVFVDYKGINVAADTKLRSDLRANGIDYSVVKNTMVRFAAKEANLDGLDEILNGTTSLAVSVDDPVAAAKMMVAAAKKNDKLKIKAGFVEGRVIDANGVKALAALPPREVLIAQVLGGFNAPITGFANVLNGNIRGLVVALNAIAEKKNA